MGTPTTSTSLERLTSRVVRLEPASPLAALADLPIVTDTAHVLKGTRFAVTEVVETLRQTPDSITYTVHVKGPGLDTRTGRLSSSVAGRATWLVRTGPRATDSTGSIPEDVRALLAGPIALAGTTDLVPVTEAATW